MRVCVSAPRHTRAHALPMIAGRQRRQSEWSACRETRRDECPSPSRSSPRFERSRERRHGDRSEGLAHGRAERRVRRCGLSRKERGAGRHVSTGVVGDRLEQAPGIGGLLNHGSEVSRNHGKLARLYRGWSVVSTPTWGTRVRAAGPSRRPRRRAPLSSRDRSMRARQPRDPAVPPVAALLVCLTDARGSRLATLNCLLPLASPCRRPPRAVRAFRPHDGRPPVLRPELARLTSARPFRAGGPPPGRARTRRARQ